ncbi:MAG: TIGR00730 family Rossman fold protein [Prevotella sp.]|nr:TIGR00730 family Rossman fold protein [Prevotella sp.]
MKIAVFCSANNNIVDKYTKEVEALGQWIGTAGHTLVYGGSNTGLMECVARAAHDAGATVIGVVPQILEKGGRVSDYIDVEIPCDNLSDRKDLMLAQADTAVALPGGIGTLDELFSVAASRTIGYHTKKIILYNINGFWDSLVHLLDDLQERGMIRGQYTDGILPVSTLQELQKKIEEMS